MAQTFAFRSARVAHTSRLPALLPVWLACAAPHNPASTSI
jgi:hypothetical protein